eukprot:CAMPEP_0198241290 /NCGR_PEP_ID=MMETSP1446-20131203/6131_1 /TAXON_ID=1461542 ORGANISM="Unidentified sp, Strain CCMP2111" /NCGR_SAMPLE_ID=MMETSP1446 /ASSEMBLY_ACC=CAM_ASM_001112 /LENGTH=619 /DNA_ID=CAMNT_0043924101 /DNA_START=1 /DNA_END=1860 /DNA_ORIENTATION=+
MWNNANRGKVPVEGSLVCFTTDEGLPLKAVKDEGLQVWELMPTSLDEDASQHYLAAECVFTVVKKGNKYGFRSWGAEGRLLQDVRSKKENPRVANYNFGSWESWTLAENKLMNCAWKTELTWNIAEVRVQVLSLLHQSDIKQRSENRDLRKALIFTEEKYGEMEGHLKHAVQTCQKQMDFAAKQIDDMQAKLVESLAKNECLSTELLEYKEINKRLQATVARIGKDKENLENRTADLKLKSAGMEKQISQDRIKHKEKVKKITSELTAENRKLKASLESRIKELEEESQGLHGALDSIASKINRFSAKNSPVLAADERPLYGENSASSVVQSDSELSDSQSVTASVESNTKGQEEQEGGEFQAKARYMVSDMESDDSSIFEGEKPLLDQSPRRVHSSPQSGRRQYANIASSEASDLINLQSPSFEHKMKARNQDIDYEGLAKARAIISDLSPESSCTAFTNSNREAAARKSNCDSSTAQLKNTSIVQSTSESCSPGVDSKHNAGAPELAKPKMKERFSADTLTEIMDSIPQIGRRSLMGKKRIMAPNRGYSDDYADEIRSSSNASATTRAPASVAMAPALGAPPKSENKVPMQHDASVDYESEDWWNSFTMRKTVEGTS